MHNNAMELEARIYLYDLRNCARENGFKAGEEWSLNQASYEEKAELEKRYYPTISTKVVAEDLVKLFGLVSNQLSQAGQTKHSPNTTLKPDKNLQYLVAFNADRVRR
jgi:hypothetical protein